MNIVNYDVGQTHGVHVHVSSHLVTKMNQSGYLMSSIRASNWFPE